jgi:hypothetical protein
MARFASLAALVVRLSPPTLREHTARGPRPPPELIFRHNGFSGRVPRLLTRGFQRSVQARQTLTMARFAALAALVVRLSLRTLRR